MSCEILAKPAHRYMRPEILGDRTRVDLMWNSKTLGIRGPSREDGTFSFWAIQRPDTVSPLINEMMQEFTATPPPLQLAQIRFREGISRNGEKIKGLWIDTANESIRDLLNEEVWLRSFLDQGWIIEIGQKKKEVVCSAGEEGVELQKCTGRVWLPSYDLNNKEIPIDSYISLFSQPGPETNRALIAAGFDLLDTAGIKKLRWAEWGAGYGNLTAAFLSRLGPNGSASELEPPAAELLSKNIQTLAPGFHCEQRISEKGPSDFERKVDLWLIDPPRPGFGALLENLKKLEEPPQYVLAYHCHAKGLINDSKILKESNYRLLNWSSVDAFPATAHHEVISLWEFLRPF